MKHLAILFALAAPAALAQAPPDASPSVTPVQAPSPMEVWGGANLGVNAAPLFAGVGAHVSAGRGRTALRVGYDGAEALSLLGGPATSLRAVSLSAEVRTKDGPVHFSAFAGPSVVWGLRPYENGGRTRYESTGLAVGGAAFVEIGPGFALGFDVSGNLNGEVSTVGGRLATHVRLK